ncbi:hypothetical protein BY458DRAFT_507246 [Sporodiniella umbellata]|nr:hypothetical protein BY458DRAFT_507246 [Sporodiniella umbellata]
MGWVFDEPMESFANDLLSHIPSDIDLCQQDNQFPAKMKAVLDFVRQVPGAMNDAKQALLMELHYLVHGCCDSKEEAEEGEMICLDVLWQHVRFDKQPALEAISGLLNQLGQTRTDFSTSQRVSQWNLEVLIRTLLYEEGYAFVLKKLTSDPNADITDERIQIFSMDEARVYLTERDKYTMWMIVLYYFVTHSLPDRVCRGWMDALIKTGQAKAEKPLFVIDWSPMLENRPFSKQGQMACANILLSMLNHFGNKACNDPSRTPLLIGVLQTLFNFLSFSPSYKVAGALVLARKVSSLTSLQPEMQMIEMDLETKSGRKGNRALIQMVLKEKNIEQRLVIGFYLVSRLPAKEREDLLTMASVLGACVGCFANNHDDLVLTVDKIRQTYLHQLELDMLSVHNKKSNTRQMKSCSFAWLNLLVFDIPNGFGPRRCKKIHQVRT